MYTTFIVENFSFREKLHMKIIHKPSKYALLFFLTVFLKGYRVSRNFCPLKRIKICENTISITLII